MLAAKKGDLWTLRSDWGFGPQDFEYTETVLLPAGAVIVSVSPEPELRFRSHAGLALRWKARCDPGEHFRYLVEYRLAEETASSGLSTNGR